MTLEKRYLVEISDIISVQYECGNCGAAVLVPIDRIDSERIAGIAVNMCPYCQTPSGFQIGVEETKVFLHFNQMLRQIAKVMSGRNLKIRLEVKAPE
jgi:hypothetical protein